LIAKALDVNESWLMGYDVPMERTRVKYPDNILKIETKKFPLLGTIAAGIPIFAEEQFESYVEAGANIRADFCLKVQGDSMINARICDGDIVFIGKQSDVNDGEIAAVLIEDEATLKRVYKKKNEIILVAENPAYAPMVYKNEELNQVRILGKAIAFQSNVI
jgi:repressor LexA